MYMKEICSVTEQLLEHYGDRLAQVERMSEHSYRATLKGGDLVHAVAMPDGSLLVREPDGPWA